MPNAQSTSDDDPILPDHCRAEHNIGEAILEINDIAVMGNLVGYYSMQYSPCFPDIPWLQPVYPKGGQGIYEGFWGLWVGAIKETDTLVSTAVFGRNYDLEFAPDQSGLDRMRYRTTLDPDNPDNRDAVSEQDFIAMYTDTLTSYAELDAMDQRPHRPLDIRVKQSSYAWSYGYAEDFILFEFDIWNIGSEPLDAMYVGFEVLPQVYHKTPYIQGDQIEITGFLPEYQVRHGSCSFADTLNLAWHAHYDGHFFDPNPEAGPVPHVAGIRFLNRDDRLNLSYNWWTSCSYEDFGPQSRKKFRNLMTGGLGRPIGDRNKYHYLRNGEIDYNTLLSWRIGPNDPVWIDPELKYLTCAFSCYYLLSLGPYYLEPGDHITVPLAYVVGKDLHTDPYNFRDYVWNFENDSLTNFEPETFYANLNYSDLVKNARWAEWIYDNPGVDTDSDGYAGKYHLCCADSTILSVDSTVTPWDTVWQQGVCEQVWYEGDGVPDWKAVSPPPAPKVWIKPDVGSIHVRFNGTYSENTKDIFLQTIDFEGYRVYLSRDARKTSYSMLASYDRENYDKYVWIDSRRVWELTNVPLSLDQCRCLYGASCGDSTFDPIAYPRSRPYFMPGFADSVFYFAPHDFNQSMLGVTTPIRKVYPDQPYPSSLVPDSADSSDLTEEGLLKFFEYELTIDNLLPTVQYYVNVTAFDFGAPQLGLTPFETSVTLQPKIAYAMPDGQDVVEKNLKAYVYPNPYRIDADYYGKGYEGRDAQYYIPDRLRRIHFANLPPKCTISIFTLDGDLVRRLDHDKDPSDPAASHDTWDLITRNTQAVVSGIYYWTVEQPDGETQIGKLVIIK